MKVPSLTLDQLVSTLAWFTRFLQCAEGFTRRCPGLRRPALTRRGVKRSGSLSAGSGHYYSPLARCLRRGEGPSVIRCEWAASEILDTPHTTFDDYGVGNVCTKVRIQRQCGCLGHGVVVAGNVDHWRVGGLIDQCERAKG